MEEGSDAYKIAAKELEDELTAIARAGKQEREGLAGQEIAKRVEAMSIENVRAVKRQSDEEVALSGEYAKGLINRQQYEEKKRAIVAKYEQEAFDASINGLKGLLDNPELSGEGRLDLEKQIAQKEIDLEQWKNEQKEKSDLEYAEAHEKLEQKQLELLQESISAVFTFMSQASERRINEIDAQIEALEKQKEAELLYIENSIASEEEREARRAEIDSRYAARQSQLEAKKKDEQRKQAVYQKQQGIISAVINTAIGVSGALSTQPTPLGIALAAIVAAIGAVQIATIASQPLPKYARGTADHPGGLAVTGDAGRSEMVITRDGRVFKTPAVPTVMNLPAHAVVLPDYRAAMSDDLQGFLSNARANPPDRDREITLRVLEGIDERLRENNRVTREYMHEQLKLAYTGRYNSTLTATRKSMNHETK
jgi:hypothetical protein